MPNNRAVFITGAAAGIGRATALTFAKNGYTVGGYDIDEVGPTRSTISVGRHSPDISTSPTQPKWRSGWANSPRRPAGST
jgi:nucleoside-diphosphate-sugar epimerase